LFFCPFQDRCWKGDDKADQDAIAAGFFGRNGQSKTPKNKNNQNHSFFSQCQSELSKISFPKIKEAGFGFFQIFFGDGSAD
jgi:hypothetical protein